MTSTTGADVDYQFLIFLDLRWYGGGICKHLRKNITAVQLQNSSAYWNYYYQKSKNNLSGLMLLGYCFKRLSVFQISSKTLKCTLKYLVIRFYFWKITTYTHYRKYFMFKIYFIHNLFCITYMFSITHFYIGKSMSQLAKGKLWIFYRHSGA